MVQKREPSAAFAPKIWGLIRKHTSKPKKRYALGISEVKEIPFTDIKIVWKVLNVE
jgi:hypothetical protein